MTSCIDVASYIVEKHGPFASSYLHRLMYYCQAWHLVWTDRPLFYEPIEAWLSGPIVASFWSVHHGNFVLAEGMEFLKEKYELSDEQQRIIDAVVRFYNSRYNSQDLAHLAMREDPWRIAREGVAPTERGAALIKNEWIKDYYTSILERPER